MKQLVIYNFFFCISFISCYQEINLDKYRTPPVLVLNAYLIADSAVAVSLTHTWFSTDVTKDVTVPDAEISLIVNGEYLETLEWREIKEGLNMYTSTYCPQEGDIIKIIAVSGDYGTVEAEEYIPYKTKIEHVKISHQRTHENGTLVVSSGSSDYYMGHEFIYNITFRDQPGVKNYYFVELRSYGETIAPGYISYSREPVFLAQENELDVILSLEGLSDYMIRVFSDDLFDGQEYTLTISELIHYVEDLKDIKREVILHTISESYFKYLHSMAILRSEGVIKKLSDIGFADPVYIYSNIEGGTGILGTGASSSYMLTAIAN